MPKEIPITLPSMTAIVAVIAVLLILVGANSAVYTIDPEEVGVVLRLGRHTGDLAQPGLNFKLPFGIDRVYKVPILRQQKEEFGFRTIQSGVSSQFLDHTRDPNLLLVSLMVTGDLNAALVEWIVQYRISDPAAFLFNVRNPIETLRNTAEAVLRSVVGDRTVDEVLTIGRQEIENVAQTELQTIVNRYEMGISIEQVVLQDVNPPDAVKDSFNEVNRAQQERERLINGAKAEYNRAVPRARGEAKQRILEAEGYATERVNRAKGDTARFEALLEQYTKAPEVTRRRMYLETMQTVLPLLGDKIIVDENANSVLPLLQLGRDERSTP